MRKVGLYIRVSTEEQAKRHEGSLDSQKYRLEEYVKARNMMEPGWGKIADSYIDEAKSAKDTNRPEYRKMLRDIERKKIDTIMVTELSRLNRNTKDFIMLLDFLSSHKAKFTCLSQQIDTTTAAGEMIMLNLMNYAQYERKQTAERVSANFLARSQRGLFNGGYPSLGYDPDQEKKGHLIVNEKEADQVRKIFELFHEKGSLQATVNQLKIDGTQTKKHVCQDKTIVGGKDFALNTLWGLLRNRHYIAEREINKRHRFSDKEKVPTGKEYRTAKATWAPIVPKPLFEAVQEQLNNNLLRYKPESRRTFDYIYSSVVHCPDCGQVLVGISGKSCNGDKYYYYSHKGRKTGKCVLHRIDALKLHHDMRERFRVLAESPALLERLYQSAESDQITLVPENDRRVTLLESELKELEKKSRNLIESLQTLSEG